MKKSIAFSLVAFLVVAAYILVGVLTQMLMGVVDWGDAPFFVGIAIFSGSVVAAIFYLVFNKFAGKIATPAEKPEPYKPGPAFIVVSVILVAASSTYSGIKSYSVGSEQLAVKEQGAKAAEARRLASAKAAEIERQRVAALPPEQRLAEEQRNRAKAEAAAKAAAAEIARQQAAAAKAVADKKKKDLQLQLAGAGALMLKRAMKDPEAFELKWLFVRPDGTACYTYRAKNSFGAVLPSNAVLTSTGKMLLEERNGNSFVGAWNKNCAGTLAGDDIAPLIKSLGILD